MKTDFKECLERGVQGERILDRYFRKNYDYDIRPATKQEQKQGIDRIFTHKNKQYQLRIEYKTDDRAHETGNACLEMAKNLKPYLPGWAETCSADYLIYYVPGRSKAFIIQPEALKLYLPAWLIAHPLRIVKSQGIYQNYQTQCLLVPLRQIEAISAKVVTVKL